MATKQKTPAKQVKKAAPKKATTTTPKAARKEDDGFQPFSKRPAHGDLVDFTEVFVRQGVYDKPTDKVYVDAVPHTPKTWRKAK